MFLILKTTDWKEDDYIKSNIIPFGWSEDDGEWQEPLVELEE